MNLKNSPTDIKSQIRAAMPYLYVILALVLIVAIYFKPAVFDGKAIVQSDRIQFWGMFKEAQDHINKYKEEPIWTNSMFAGMPTYTFGTESPGEKALIFIDHYILSLNQFLGYPAGIILMNFIGFFILLLAFDVKPLQALAGAIVFTMASNTFVSFEAGHTSKLRAMGTAPIVLAGVVWLMRQKYLLGFAIAGLGTAVHLKTGHYQITYYLFFIIAGYILSEIPQIIAEKRIVKALIAGGLMAVALFVGLAGNAGKLLSTMEYLPLSMRGKSELTPKNAEKPQDESGGLDRDYVFNWSMGVAESFTHIIPSFYGGASGQPVKPNYEAAKMLRSQRAGNVKQLPYYWGDQPFTSGPNYLGAVAVFIFVLGLFVLDKKYRWWLGILLLFSIMLTWGKNFSALNYLLFDYLPGYNKFRSVTMATFISQFVLALGVAITLKYIFDSNNTFKITKLYWSGAIVGGICLIFALVPSLAGSFTGQSDGQLPDWLIDAVITDRKKMLQTDALRSFALIGLAFGLIILYIRKTLKPNMVLIGLVLVLLIDYWPVNKRYLNDSNFERKLLERTFKPTQADKKILTDTDPHYRVLNLNNPFNESRTSYYHKSIGGYSPVKIRRFQDLIEGPLGNEIQDLIGRLQKQNFAFSDMAQLKMLNMFNVKYLIANPESEQGVITNPYALGHGWVSNNIKLVEGPDAEMNEISSNTFNPKQSTIIDKTKFDFDPSTVKNDTSAKVMVKSYLPNKMIYSVELKSPSLVVFPEVFYDKGWKCFEGEKELKIIRANYALRAVKLDAGTHNLEMKFIAETFLKGSRIAFFANTLLLAMFFGAIGFELFNRFKKQNS